MNKKIVTGVALACLMTFAPQPAQADPKAEFLATLENVYASYKRDHPPKAKPTSSEKANYAAARKQEFIAKVCKKGSFSSGVFSVRSLEGVACNHTWIGAWAMVNCKDIDSFDTSKCRKNAVSALKKELNKKDVSDSDAQTYLNSHKENLSAEQKEAL